MKQKIYPFLVLITVCSIIGVPVALYFSCGGIFYTPVSEYFGVSRGMYALSGSVMSLFFALAAPKWGKAVETKSIKWMIVICLVICSGTYFLMSTFRNIYMFFISGALFGTAHGLLMLIVTPTVINRWFEKNVGFFVGLSSSMSGVGGVIFNPIGARIIENYSWQSAFVFFGVLVAAIPLPLTLLILRDNPEDIGIKPFGAGTHHDSEAASLSRNRGIRFEEARHSICYPMLVLVYGLISVCNCYSGYCASYAISLGMSVAISGTVASIMSIGILVGKNCVGALCDRNLTLGSGVAILSAMFGFVILLFFGAHSAFIVYVGTFLYGLCVCTTPVLVPLLVMREFGPKDHSYITGKVSVPSQVINAVIMPALGFLTNMRSGFTVILVIFALCALAGFICAEVSIREAKKLVWKD